jgi:CHAT domain-containing protein
MTAIQERERRIGGMFERLALADARDPADNPLLPPGVAIERPALDDGTVILEYLVHDGGGLVFVLTSDGLTVAPLAADTVTIHRHLDFWQLNLERTIRSVADRGRLTVAADQARGLLERLYRALLAPVAAHLVGRDRLIVIPYGPTHALPFAALHDGQHYLIERLEVSVCPSSSLLQLCAERARLARPGALVLAHSDDGRLPHVREEARLVASVLAGDCFIDERATRTVLEDAAPRHGVLHLAAHGEARLDNPAFAYIQLADGHLSTADVFGLPLDGALVTLSACETGRGVVTGGDEVIGLSRGFLYAGAATVIQSLWRVEDGSTASLMAHFYRALGEGQAKGTALRAAQLALLHEERTAGHPFFWAPFQLVGDSGPLLGVAASDGCHPGRRAGAALVTGSDGWDGAPSSGREGSDG